VKIVIFGLTISSSWGNGHATLWRGLCKALIQSGHDIVFYERNVPYYAEMRDLHEIPGGRLELYDDWQSARERASTDLAGADVAIITSYCPDSLAASEIVLEQGRALRVFYDLDTPVTLARLEAGECVPYIAASGLGDFDLVLSYSGGRRSMVMSIRICIIRPRRCRTIAPIFPIWEPTRKTVRTPWRHCWWCQPSCCPSGNS
jgi:spore maturation protein CgeB